MFLALTPAGGEDAARTAGQETGATSRSGAEKWSHYCLDFGPFRLKNGPKTPENGPKSASSGYLSVSSMFL
jgi:hypothetical protein